MKKKTQRIVKIAAFAAFALAMLLNLKSNIIGESSFSKAFATETGPPDTDPDTGTDTDGTTMSDKKFAWSFPTCTGTRMCGNKSQSFSGIKLKCVSGSDYANCTDATGCTPNTACAM